MEGFWDFLTVVAIINATLIVLFLVLISLPQSRFGKIFLKILGVISYAMVGLFVLYVINPIDLIPDVIPVVGQTDDAMGIAGVIIDAVIGYISLKKAREDKGVATTKTKTVNKKNATSSIERPR